MSKSRTEAKTALVKSGGNVFADLGLRATEQDMLKARMALSINQTIRKRNLTQAEAAKILGIDQPKVSLILRGRLDGFSLERLLAYLLTLGRDLEVRIPEKVRKVRGRLLMTAS